MSFLCGGVGGSGLLRYFAVHSAYCQPSASSCGVDGGEKCELRSGGERAEGLAGSGMVWRGIGPIA